MNPLSLILKNKLSSEKISVGLDIGTSTVKVIKLKSSKEKTELCDFVLESTPVDLTPFLQKVAQSQNIPQKINISVSGPSVIIRYINFPQMNDAEFKQALKFEAAKYIPFPVAELNLDGCILKSNLPDNKMLVLLSGVKKEFINQRLKSFELAGLRVDIIDIDSLALINAFNFNYSEDESLKDKTVALLNIGASFSNLNILENGIPRLSRDIQIAGNNFTKKIADCLGMDFKTVEAAKLNPLKDTPEIAKDDKGKLKSISAIGEQVISILATEVRTSFDYYESQNASNVEKIFLSGAGSKFLGLKDTLSNLLGIQVEYWDSLAQVNSSSGVDSQKLKELSSELAVAVGLALRS